MRSTVESSSGWPGQTNSAIRLLAVADRLDQQVAQRPFREHLPEHVEDLAAKRLALLLELLKERQVDGALPSLHRDEVPQVTDLVLPDPVDPAEALLDP